MQEIAASVGLTAKEIGGKGTVSTKYMRKTSTETSGMLLQVHHPLHVVSLRMFLILPPLSLSTGILFQPLSETWSLN